MKHNIQTLRIVCSLMMFFHFSTTSFAQCDTCAYTKKLVQNPHSRQKVNVPDFFLTPLGEFQGCKTDSSNIRNITFIHGLGGDAGSWEKPATWTSEEYVVGVDKVNYSGKGWETSFYSVAKEINKQISSNLRAGLDERYPNRYKTDDYVIAHSQGGIAARHLDRYWDLNQPGFGSRKFYGLVTFGTSHAGADIALSRKEQNTFIRKVVSTLILEKVNSTGYNLTKKFGFLFGSKLIDLTTGLDSLIERKLVPFMVTDLHTQTLDQMAPGSKQMKDITNHSSRLRKVVFYGIEDAPECWRVIDNITGTSASKHRLFEAVKDDELLNKMEAVRAEHVLQLGYAQNRFNIAKYKYKLGLHNIIPIFRKVRSMQLASIEAEIKHRQKAIDFLNHANTEWRYLIGSYHPDSLENVKITYYIVTAKLKRGSRTVDVSTKRFSNLTQAAEFASHIKQFANYQTVISKETKTERRLQFFPSDGVVLARSQVAFPGINSKNIAVMEGDNHFQERNSPNTKRRLQELYAGSRYDPYFKIIKRKK
jgi:hypothetical protein